jgi:putative endonuclease
MDTDRINTRELGTQGEEKAVAWLLAHGHQIVSRNFRKRGFEIDIIATDEKGILRFIEVKNVIKGHVLDAVTSVETRNMARYFGAADSFICEHPQYKEYKMSMDVLIIHIEEIIRYENVTSDFVL